MITNAMTDSAILSEAGRRMKQCRLNLNLSQNDVAVKAGISRRALQKMESGSPATLLTLIRILRVYEKLSSIDSFLPEPGISPIQLARLMGRMRKRAGKPRRQKKIMQAETK